VFLQPAKRRLPSPFQSIVCSLKGLPTTGADCDDFSYGSSGFVIYWMMSWLAMCALGGAVESVITILTPHFIAFFLLMWIIGAPSLRVSPLSSPIYADSYMFIRRSECLCLRPPTCAAPRGLPLRLCNSVLSYPTDNPERRFWHS
jgi:hypothetical protein